MTDGFNLRSWMASWLQVVECFEYCGQERGDDGSLAVGLGHLIGCRIGGAGILIRHGEVASGCFDIYFSAENSIGALFWNTEFY